MTRRRLWPRPDVAKPGRRAEDIFEKRSAKVSKRQHPGLRSFSTQIRGANAASQLFSICSKTAASSRPDISRVRSLRVIS
jgi:hypothetical protein